MPIFSGLYSEYVTEWLKYFPLGKKLHIVDGDNLVAKPWEELDRVQDFLKVPKEITKKNFLPSTEKEYYCFKQSPKDRVVTCMDQTKGRRQEEVSDGLRRRLNELFKPYNLKLFKLLGRTFDWSV